MKRSRISLRRQASGAAAPTRERGEGCSHRDKLPDDAPLGWAELLKRVFGVDGWECPDCGKRMHLRTVVEGSPAALTITTSLLRSTGPPRRSGGGDDREVYVDA